MNINTGVQQDLRFLAARFNQKGCWQVWGWRCPKLPLDLFQFQKMDPFFLSFFPILSHGKSLGWQSNVIMYVQKMHGAW